MLHQKTIVSAFVLALLSGSFGCANSADDGGNTGGSSGGDACQGGDACETERDACGSLVCSCGHWVDNDTPHGYCDGSGSSSNTSSSSSSGGGSACDLQTFYPHWRPGDLSLVFNGQEVKFHFFGGGPGDQYCAGYIQDPSQPVENQNYTCLLQLCDGAPVTFDVEYQRQGSTSTQFVFDMCSFPGSGDWCDSQGQGVNCANIAGASNAAVWVSKDDPNNAGFWIQGNGSTQNMGAWNITPDNLACTRDGAFTVPSN